MKTVMNDPVLQFDFQSEDPVVFSSPEQIISTWKLNEVIECLNKIEEAIDKGYYAAGYISYEAVYAFNAISNPPKSSMPLLWFGIFPKVIDGRIHRTGPFSVDNWQMKQTKKDYAHAFQTIQEAIQNKKTNQVNYTVQFESHFSGCTYSYYEQLKKAQSANYCAYLDIGDYQILSASPELFFEQQNNIITVRPMKGTIHRGRTYEEDIRHANYLRYSKKDKLENDLITELMKTELENVAVKDSIHITDRYKIEKYPTVYQMTSTINGTLLPECTAIDIIKALFPCGSISGVPKEATVEFISQIEPFPRNVYCGAIGYITPNQHAVFNVPIRTVTVEAKTNKMKYGAGGAITEFSKLQEEYKEMLTKTKVLHEKKEPFQLIETFGLIKGEFLVFEEHMERLKKSAVFFDFTLDIENIMYELIQYKKKYKVGSWRLRLLVNEKGKIHIDIFPLTPTGTVKVAIADRPVDKHDRFLYHKTTNRTIYEELKLEEEDIFDTLLWNKEREITEFTIGNIVVELDGKLVTPPVGCGLLPGTFRESLLRKGIIEERKISIAELHHSTRIWLINSVREWVPVELVG